MQNIVIDNISLILLLPLWLFLMIMGGRFFSVYINKKIIYILTLLSSALGSVISLLSLIKYNSVTEFSLPFIKINDFIIDFGLRVDKLSLIMAFILFVVSFAVQLFSVSYMKEEKKNYRFFALLNLFNFAMGSMLFSPNLFQTYVFWEIIGIVSYILIGFDYKKISKSDASKRVFLVNRVGDTALIAGIILTSYFLYSYSGNLSFVSLGFDDMNAISVILSAYTSTPVFTGICSLLIIGCIVKSAQFPFHIWLQDAMEGDLPVSALLHSATMVAAGVYLCIRLMPLFTMNEYLIQALAVIGIFTAIVCSLYASVETQPKKVLAYSTSANLGFMFLSLGLESVKAALFLFITHAVIKSLLFILLPREKESMPVIKSVLFFTGALSLSGLLLSGVGAKEILFAQVFNHPIISILVYVAVFLSAFSVLRLGIILGINRTEKVPLTELIPPFILTAANIVFYIFLRTTENYHISLIYLCVLISALSVFILGKFNLLQKFNKTFDITEIILYKFVPKVYNGIASFTNKTEQNIFYNYKPVTCMLRFGVRTFDLIENNIMNRTVNLIANISKNLSGKFMKLQTGNIQTYNFYALIIVTIIISLIIFAYKIIINQMS